MENKNSSGSLYELFPYPSRSHINGKAIEKYLKWVLPCFHEKDLSFFSGKKIIDVGCGTGEFATALALHGATVKGIDKSVPSIAKAKAFAEKMNAKKIEFEQADLFEYPDKALFDIVFSLGVLHHTGKAEKGFEKIVSFCKPSGFVCIGLYNKYGRFRHRLKRFLLRLLAGKDIPKRMALAKKLFRDERAVDEAWLADKYGQTIESYHSVSEVLGWFKKNGITFIGCRPEFDCNKSLVLQQLKWLFDGKGAFFVMAGKKGE